MPKMLNDGAVEYEDGTSATEAQVCLPLHVYVFMHTYVYVLCMICMPACTTITDCLNPF